MEDVKQPPAREVHEALYDGADLKVTHCDGRAEMVKVRKIPRSEFAAYALAVTDEGEQGEADELRCYVPGRDDAWWAGLTDESREAIAAEGTRLNFPDFARWWRRRARLVNLASQDTEAIRRAAALLESDPTLSRPPGSRNGSPPPAIRVPLSGPGPRTSSR